VFHINFSITSQRTEFVTIVKASRLMLFRKVIGMCCENRKEHSSSLRAEGVGFLNVKASSTQQAVA
jgi:hypothetical protein